MARRRSLLNSGTRKTLLPSSDDGGAPETEDASTPEAPAAETSSPEPEPEPSIPSAAEPPPAPTPAVFEDASDSFPPVNTLPSLAETPAGLVSRPTEAVSKPAVPRRPAAPDPEPGWGGNPSFPPGAMIESATLLAETPSPATEAAAPPPEAALPPAPEPISPRPLDVGLGLHSPRTRGGLPPAQDYEEAATVEYVDHGPGPLDDAYDYDDAPPTEEVPNAVLQDISQPYSAPMHVPEPPPIPGIFDRFTPAGAQPRGRAKIERRPSYIAATPTPPPMLRSLEEAAKPPPIQPRIRPDESLEPERGKAPLVAFVFVVVLCLILVVLLAAITMWYSNQVGNDGTISVEVPTPTPVEQPLPTPEPELEEPVEPDPEPVAPTPTPTPEPVRPSPVAPSPEPARPQPVRPTPTPAAPDPEPAPSPAALGTVQINSNRRVMVYVDGKAIGFTPRTYKAPAGPLSVSAMIPRQPQSKQTQEVSVRGGATKTIDFTF